MQNLTPSEFLDFLKNHKRSKYITDWLVNGILHNHAAKLKLIEQKIKEDPKAINFLLYHSPLSIEGGIQIQPKEE